MFHVKHIEAMNKLEIYKYAEAKLVETGLEAQNWGCVIDENPNRFGVCSYSEKTIYISWAYAQYAKKEQIIDIILHEVAHALTPNQYHNNKWKEACIMLGCKPEIHFDELSIFADKSKLEEFNTKYFNYIAKCNHCGLTMGSVRPIKNQYGCKKCGNGEYNEGFKLVFEKNYKKVVNRY